MSFCLATYIFLILRTSDNMQDDRLQPVVNRFLKIVGARQPKPILLLTHGNRNRSSVATVGQSSPVTGFFSVQQPDFGTLSAKALISLSYMPVGIILHLYGFLGQPTTIIPNRLNDYTLN